MPHDISCDALHVTFRADPDRIAQFLPPGVELEVVQGQVDPTGQALPALAARVSRPVAPDEG